MISTWKYFEYRGKLSTEACQTAWHFVNQKVVEKRTLGGADNFIGRRMDFPAGVAQDKVWVDLYVRPRQTMTWRMLGEGVVGGMMVCSHGGGKGYQFRVTAVVGGIERDVGGGQITSRANRVESS